MPRLRPLLVLATLLSAPAFAGEYYLEGPEQPARRDAAALGEAVEGAEARVVRRFRPGDGWVWVMRAEGFASSEAASAAAAAATEATGVEVRVFGEEGEVVLTASREASPEAPDEQAAREASPEAADPAPAEVATRRSDDEVDALPILEGAVRTHGVDARTLAAVDGGGEALIRYRRTLPDGRVVEHLWASRAGALYLEVTPVEGSARPSRTRVLADTAWLQVDDQDWKEQNVEKARLILERFGPLEAVPFVLALGAAFEGRRELERMIWVGEQELDGRRTVVLRFEGDQLSGPMEVALDAEDQLVRRVSFEDGSLVHEFDGYREVGSLQLPSTVRTLRDGAVVDSVEVLELTLDPRLPDAWFQAPS